MKIAIVDYGMGNIRSIVSALKYIDVQNIIVSSNNQELKQADKIILPGVGSFGKAMQLIQNKNLDSILNELVVQRQKPVLGICLGMQLLGMFSDEDGFNQGLGFIDGNTDIFDSNNVTVPHVGCNQVIVGNLSRLYQGMGDILDFYFVHSFYVKPELDSDIVGSTDYICQYTSAVARDNLFATQFHPEKSQDDGLRLLKNFLNWQV